MIVSHKHKFIFIKTLKTSGTSVEIVLSKYVGNEDILSDIDQDNDLRKRLTGKSAQRHLLPPSRWRPRHLPTILSGHLPVNYREHMSALQIKEIVGEKMWNDYFKFTIVRNPYDRMISRYYYSTGRKGSKIEKYRITNLNMMIRYNANFVNDNWPMYTVSDQIMVDFVMKYETMTEDFKQVALRTGLPETLGNEYNVTFTKSDFRKDRRENMELLDDQSRSLIYGLCIREFENFGYSKNPLILKPGQAE